MINILRTRSKDYRGVQEQLLGTILPHLPENAYTTTDYERAEGCLNFSLFILARGARKLAGRIDLADPAFHKYLPDVVMSHGLADKHYLTKKDEHGAYYANHIRHLLVPGAWLKRKLLAHSALRLTPAQVHVVGWPRLDELRARAAQTPRAPAGNGKPKVLWAPTHDFVKRGAEQQSTSSYPALLNDLPELERHFDVEVSLHPRNRDKKRPTVRKLIECDYVISDFGTLVYEAWALGKPVVFPRWILQNRIQEYLPSSAEGYIFQHNIGLHAWSLVEMIEMLQARPPLTTDVTAFLNDYLDPTYDRCSGKRIAEVLLQLDRDASAAGRAARDVTAPLSSEAR